MSKNVSELQIEKEKNECEFKNGYYKIVYKDKKWNDFFDNEIMIYNNTLTYYKTSHLTQNKIEWTSEKTFEIETKTYGVDSITGKLTSEPFIKFYEITRCKKNKIDFILKNAVKKPNGKFVELMGKFIKVK